MRPLTISFGKGDKAVITTVKSLDWDVLAASLTKEPPEVTDKADRGWYIPASFDNTTPCSDPKCPIREYAGHRDSEHFKVRDAITYDFDHVTFDAWGEVIIAFKDIAFAMYTTYSHMLDCKTCGVMHPRFRVVVPLNRPASYDEFMAISRKLAIRVGIENVARESFVPAQMMYLPTRRLGGAFEGYINSGAPVDVDSLLSEYEDWSDVKSWPRRADGDAVHSTSEGVTAPDEKPGHVGRFCRAYRVADAIRKYDLPYRSSGTNGRWTYAHGSVPEGAIEYDDGLKFHSHHDTDPARGQNNSFDLVRLHRFGHLDAGTDQGTAITDMPSYRRMCDEVDGLPECNDTRAGDEFVAFEPLPGISEEVPVAPLSLERFRVVPADEFSAGAPLAWIIRGVLPRAELAVIYGESGSGKSFLALDLCAAVSLGHVWRDNRTERGKVVYVCAEGSGGFKVRLRAYARSHGIELRELPGVVADAPNLLEQTDAAALYGAILTWGKSDVIVIDTLSATTPGGNENSGEDMGRVLSHCKLLHRKTGALVVLIHHSGKDATKGARGWSGLRAAADAEIEVTRNGDFRAATVTKMKDGMDGAQWPFKLKVVELGNDLEGEPESSCVIEHIEQENVPSDSGRKPPLKGLPKLVHDTLAVMAPSGTCHIDDLIAGVKMKLPKTDGPRDLRRQNINTAIARSLIPGGYAFMQGEDRIGLTSIIRVEEPSWLS